MFIYYETAMIRKQNISIDYLCSMYAQRAPYMDQQLRVMIDHYVCFILVLSIAGIAVSTLVKLLY